MTNTNMGFRSFKGCKLALFYGDQLLVYKRDDKDGIPFPGMFDLPGGGREQDESPEQCVLRELFEEFSIVLPEDRLIYRKQYNLSTPGHYAYFFTGELLKHEYESIVFGHEGESWKLMLVDEYLSHPYGIPHLQQRIVDCLKFVSA